MIRAIPIIVAAIQLSQPHMPKQQARRYAVVVRAEAKARSFDPLTLVAMVHHESHWHPSLVNSIGCVGLGQICLSNYSYCRADMQSAKCQAKKVQLQGGVYNLRIAADHITRNRKMCRKRTGKPALWRYWLPSYQGFNKPSRDVWCGQQRRKGKWVNLPIPRLTTRVMTHRRMLIRKLTRRRRR